MLNSLTDFLILIRFHQKVGAAVLTATPEMCNTRTKHQVTGLFLLKKVHPKTFQHQYISFSELHSQYGYVITQESWHFKTSTVFKLTKKK